MTRAEFVVASNAVLDAEIVRSETRRDRAIFSATPFVWRDPATIPPREWIYGHHLIRRFGSATIAQAGVGKSTLVLAEGIAIATGRPLLGITPRQRSRVWYWNGEDPRDEVERRIAAIVLHYAIDPKELQGWFFYDSGRDQEIVLAKQTRDGAVIAEPVAKALIGTIRANEIDVLQIDPFISSHRVTENDNNAIDVVAKRWTAIAEAADCAIELVHHPRKTGGAEVTVDDARGASALIGAVRSARVLNSMTKEEGERAGVTAHRRYFRAENGKSNLAPPPEGADWYEIQSFLLANGDDVGVIAPWSWPDPLADITGANFDVAAAAIRGGKWRENPQAAAWVGKAIAGALGLNLDSRGDKMKVIGVLKAWLSAGSLRIVDGLDDKSNPRKFVEVAAEL